MLQCSFLQAVMKLYSSNAKLSLASVTFQILEWPECDINSNRPEEKKMIDVLDKCEVRLQNSIETAERSINCVYVFNFIFF